MTPIAIFYHTLFFHGEPSVFAESSPAIVYEQMDALRSTGLLDAASEFIVGINGDQESVPFANLVIPAKATRVFHGLKSRSENLTLVKLEEWLKTHDGWYVLYFHAKGVTHTSGDYAERCVRWRRCMMNNLVINWKRCVADLSIGFESVGCHWMTGLCDGTQNIWGGNFWWATSGFLRTLPSIFERDRIKQSGIESLESRYEAEVWIGNGPRLPRVRDYHPNGIGQCP